MAALIDWDNAHRWMPGIDKLHANGPTEVGTTLSFHARGKDRPSEIIALEPGRRLVLRSSGDARQRQQTAHGACGVGRELGGLTGRPGQLGGTRDARVSTVPLCPMPP